MSATSDGDGDDEDIADFEVLRNVAMATMFWLSVYGVHIGAS